MRSFRRCSDVTEPSRDPIGVSLQELGPGVDREDSGSADGVDNLLLPAPTFDWLGVTGLVSLLMNAFGCTSFDGFGFSALLVTGLDESFCVL